MKSKFLNTLKYLGLITIGSFIYAFAFDWLYIPNNISLGGLTGISQIITHFIPQIPVGVLVIILNIPLFIIGVKLQGRRILITSIAAMVISSLFIDIIPLFITFHPIKDKFLVSVFGGVLVGIGLGLLLLVGATTGGTELAARLLKYKYRHISIGRLCLAIDIFIIVAYIVVSKRVDSILYAIVAMYISTLAIDLVVYGRNTSKVACIVCDDGEAMKKKLIELDLGVTEIKAVGGYSNTGKDMLICAFKPSKISELKSTIINIDKSAFVIICKADDIFGEGFAECNLNSL
ncbi:MAG: YitT family protein [Clostridiales bacterium]|nr:YitT family protein [Clostridiales bacterium]